ncbi:MAG: hypothetical protein P1V35_06765, partial [Planctomycetota bacterium]|nr:hypothetical protein [Planctomycetota bacterium]
MIAIHRTLGLLGMIGLASLITSLPACAPTSGSASTDDGGTVILGAHVENGSVFEIMGPAGGPFPEGSRTYTLRNEGAEVLEWSMDSPVDWLVTSPAGGSMASGSETQVTVEIDQVQAAKLPMGVFPSDLVLRSKSNSAGDIFMPFQLTVGEPNQGQIQIAPEEEITIVTSTGNRSPNPDGVITISNVGDGAFLWKATSDDAWLTVETSNSDILEPGSDLEIELQVDEVILADQGSGNFQTRLSFQMLNDPESTQSLTVNVQLSEDSGRISSGLVAEYHFDEGTGSIVQDRSGVSPAMNLNIENTGAVSWLPGGLSISSPTLLSTSGPATRISQSIQQSREITVEAWLRPANLNQDGPARLFGISNGPSLRNFTLGQGLWGSQPKDTFNMRLRTSSTDMDGMPLLTTSAGSASTALQHVVYTHRADGTSRIFVNGQISTELQMDGQMDNWDTSYRMAVAGEIGASRPWLGDLYLMAIYDRALTADEINQNRTAGSGAEEVGQLAVTPNAEIQITATLGQDIYINVDEFDVANLGGASLEWSAAVNQSWVSLGGTGGTLGPDQASTASIQLDQAHIMGLSPGSYTAVAQFTNNTSEYGTTAKSIRLRVVNENAPGTGDRPGPHNTGPTDASNLTNVGGMTITQDGTVVENVFVRGTIVVEADNVTIRNFKIDPGGTPYAIRANNGNTGLVIEDGELMNVSSAHIYGGNFEARRLNLHDSGGDGFKCTTDVLVEECWVH